MTQITSGHQRSSAELSRLGRNVASWSIGILLSVISPLVRAEPVSVQRLNAHGVEVRLRVEPTQTTTAGRIVAELDVTAPTSVMIDIHLPAPQPPGQLTLASATSRGPEVLRPGVMTYGLRSVFTPFLGGAYEVPGFTVAYRARDIAGQLSTKPVLLDVKSVVAGDPAVAVPDGIVPIATSPAAEPRFRATWIAAIVLLLALIGWLKFRRRPEAIAIAPPIVGPCTRALGEIDALPAPDASSLERTIESLRAKYSAPLPEHLISTYQRIRFGTPTERDVQEFAEDLKVYWQEEARREATKEVA